MPRPLGVQSSALDNGAQSSADASPRGIRRNAVQHLSRSVSRSAEQRPLTKRARLARRMSDAELFEATGLTDRAKAETRFVEDHSIQRLRRARKEPRRVVVL